MRQVEINLSEPFEKVLGCILALPPGRRDIVENGSGDDKELKQMIRELYEAANGRQVETRFGWIAIAPPVAEFLKARPYYIESQIDLLIEAAARIICGPPPSEAAIARVDTGRDGSPEPADRQHEARIELNGECSRHHVPLIGRFLSAPMRRGS